MDYYSFIKNYWEYYDTVIISISSLSILINALFVIFFIYKVRLSKGNNKNSSFEQLLMIISGIESFVSLFWILSRYIEGENECIALGTFSIFFNISDNLLELISLSHLKNIILNPIIYIMKSKKKIRNYLLISIPISILFSVLCIPLELIGRSPNTTYYLSFKNVLNNEEGKDSMFYFKSIYILLITCFPFINLLLGILQIRIVCKNNAYKKDRDNKRLFKNQSFYYIVYFIMSCFISIIYINEFSFILKNPDDDTYVRNPKLYIISGIIECITPLIAGIIRLYLTRVIKNICKLIKNKMTKKEILNLDDIEVIKDVDELNESSLYDIEKKVVTDFVKNFYISVCFCLEKMLNVGSLKFDELNEEMSGNTNKYQITNYNIYTELRNSPLRNDKTIGNNIDISCVEFAPEIFKFLRKLERIDETQIIKSMLPKNNKIGISETEGKGGSFFVNTDDNEFILKTITFEELEIIRKLLLFKMVKYLNNNNDSIISRIYGVYKIKMHNGIIFEDEIYFILMKNVIGTFTDNLLCKYDLKGSSLNRKVTYENIDQRVMKDINFNETEKVLLLNKNNSERLIQIATKDANFFCDLGIMDYSLLVAKISLNNDEINYLFGEKHRIETEMEYCKMIGEERQSLSQKNEPLLNMNDDEEYNKNIDNFHYMELRFETEKTHYLEKYFFPSLKPDLLYIISIIDFFQLFNIQKNLEAKYKKITKRVRAIDISSIRPEEYKNRFISFVKEKTDSENYLKNINSSET